MATRSGRLRVGDLSFHVYGRALHPDWFTVRAHRRITQVGWEADVRLVEGGHAIVWTSGRVRLCEALVWDEGQLPEPGLLFHSHVQRERSASFSPDPRVEYQTSFETERCDPAVFTRLSEETLLDASPSGLLHAYPRRNRMLPAPLSRIAVEARRGGLSIQAVHTFPEEHAIVRTLSLFEIRG